MALDFASAPPYFMTSSADQILLFCRIADAVAVGPTRHGGFSFPPQAASALSCSLFRFFLFASLSRANCRPVARASAPPKYKSGKFLSIGEGPKYSMHSHTLSDQAHGMDLPECRFLLALHLLHHSSLVSSSTLVQFFPLGGFLSGPKWADKRGRISFCTVLPISANLVKRGLFPLFLPVLTNGVLAGTLSSTVPDRGSPFRAWSARNFG
mmetsp:Transcript_28739/g.80913  ORF Transcript_28739/g.80913 Transcript_28739/m.80913 type:complete len:210 (+) Transcript_28739:182-811(+)